MNFVTLNNVIKTWVESQYLNPNVMFGDIYQNLNTGELKYPIVNIDLAKTDRDSDTLLYNYYVYYVDRLNEDGSNEKTLQTDGINSIQFLIDKFRKDDDFSIVLPVSITPIRQQFADNLAGAWASFQVRVGTDLNHCSEDSSEPLVLNIDEDGTYNVQGLDQVVVDTSDMYGPLSVTANGTYTASGSDLYGYSSVEVDVHEANTIKANGLSASLPGSTELLSVIGNSSEVCSGVTEVVSTTPIKYYQKNPAVVDRYNAALELIFPNAEKIDITCTEDSNGPVICDYYSYFANKNLKTVIVRGDFLLNTTVIVTNSYASTTANSLAVETVSFPDLTKTASRNYGQAAVIQAYQGYANINKVEFPKLVEVNRALISGTRLWKLEEIELPECTAINRDITSGANDECPALTRIYAPKATHFVNGYDDFIAYTDYYCPRNLIDIEIGDADNGYYLNENIRMYRYKPVNVLADADKVAIMNENIRNHIAYNCENIKGTTKSLTITFRTETYNALEEATKLAFANKGWLVASLS